MHRVRTVATAAKITTNATTPVARPAAFSAVKNPASFEDWRGRITDGSSVGVGR